MCRVNGGIGGIGQAMGALKRVNGALVRVNGGIGQHWSGLLKRVNGGVGQCQWGIEKGQWGHWSGSMGAIEKGQVRQGLGFGSGRGVAVGQTGVWLWVRQEVVLQGCKLYLAGL